MSLKEIIKPLSGNKKVFFLLRIADLDTKAALKIVGVVRATYNYWFQNQEFVDLYRQVKEFRIEYRQEAIQLLRRDNQLSAVLLESEIISQIRKEVAREEYVLTKTNLAREVYSKLIGELDFQPQVQALTWEQRISNLFVHPKLENQEISEIVEGEVRELQEGNNEVV